MLDCTNKAKLKKANTITEGKVLSRTELFLDYGTKYPVTDLCRRESADQWTAYQAGQPENGYFIAIDDAGNGILVRRRSAVNTQDFGYIVQVRGIQSYTAYNGFDKLPRIEQVLEAIKGRPVDQLFRP